MDAHPPRRLATGAFGYGRHPPACELCDRPWDEGARPSRVRAGRRDAWACWPCTVTVSAGGEAGRCPPSRP